MSVRQRWNAAALCGCALSTIAIPALVMSIYAVVRIDNRATDGTTTTTTATFDITAPVEQCDTCIAHIVRCNVELFRCEGVMNYTKATPVECCAASNLQQDVCGYVATGDYCMHCYGTCTTKQGRRLDDDDASTPLPLPLLPFQRRLSESDIIGIKTQPLPLDLQLPFSWAWAQDSGKYMVSATYDSRVRMMPFTIASVGEVGNDANIAIVFTEEHTYVGEFNVSARSIRIFESMPGPSPFALSANWLLYAFKGTSVSLVTSIRDGAEEAVVFSANGTYGFELLNEQTSLEGKCFSASQPSIQTQTASSSDLPFCVYENIGTLQDLGMVDPASPLDVLTKVVDGELMQLVYSDEFEDPTRASTSWTETPSLLPYWQDNNVCYGNNYTIEGGDMVIRVSGDALQQEACAALDETACRSYTESCPLCAWSAGDSIRPPGCYHPPSSVQASTFNAQCFSGGYVEINVTLPTIPGAWPGLWTLGNLARVNYRGSVDGMWPYAQTDCNDTGFVQTNGLSPLRVSNCPQTVGPQGNLIPAGYDIPGWEGRVRIRGVPEYDVAEVMTDPYQENPSESAKLSVDTYFGDNLVKFVSQSFQVAPLDGPNASYDPSLPEQNFAGSNPYGSPFRTGYMNNNWTSQQPYVSSSNFVPMNGSCIPNYAGITMNNSVGLEMNYWNGCQFQQAYSVNSALNDYNTPKIFALHYEPSLRPGNGFVEWFQSDYGKTWRMEGTALDGYTTTSRVISAEPSYIIMQVASAPQWGGGMNLSQQSADMGEMRVHSVRVYQSNGKHNTGCSTPMFPTKTYIAENVHSAFTDLSMGGYPNVKLTAHFEGGAGSKLNLVITSVGVLEGSSSTWEYVNPPVTQECTVDINSICTVDIYWPRVPTTNGYTQPKLQYKWEMPQNNPNFQYWLQMMYFDTGNSPNIIQKSGRVESQVYSYVVNGEMDIVFGYDPTLLATYDVLPSFTVVVSGPLDCYDNIGSISLYEVCPSFPMWINTKNDTYIDKVYNAFQPFTFVNTFIMMQFLASACYTLTASNATYSVNTPPASCKMQVDSLGGSSLYYSVPASSCNLDGGGSTLVYCQTA